MKLIWKSIKLVIFCKLLKMMMGIGLLVFSIFMFKGYSDYKDALEKKPLAQAMEEIVQKPSYVSLEQVPDIYKQALVAVEDHRFYDHMGVDVIATGRAVINDIKAMDFVEAEAPSPNNWQKICILARRRRWTERQRKCLWR